MAEDYRQNRLDKLARLRDAGIQVYPDRFETTHTLAEVMKLDDGAKVKVAGRMVARRVMGKLTFAKLQDLRGAIQISLGKKELSEDLDASRRLFKRFDKLVDRRDPDFLALWNADPVPPRQISVRYLASVSTSPPAIPLEKNEIPTLVINQELDEMVDVELTRHNYARLGGPKKYLEVPFGHWSSQPEFWQTIVEATDVWFREHGGEM